MALSISLTHHFSFDAEKEPNRKLISGQVDVYQLVNFPIVFVVVLKRFAVVSN